MLGRGRVILGDNIRVVADLADESIDLIYVDPPFNTGHDRRFQRIRTVRDEHGDRIGFQGRRYRTHHLGETSYADVYDNYVDFLESRLREFRRVLKPTGSLYLHVDYREVHYCKVLLDRIFGRDCFLNEIIWAYDYGGRTKRRWPPKHDNILLYVKRPTGYYFDLESVDRIPYMAPGLVGPEKAARGKTPTDCYSADTEILTRRGWIRFPDLQADDEVGTVSPCGQLTYVRPTAIQAYDYEGPMYLFGSRTVDLLVTPNHRLWARRKHAAAYTFHLAEHVMKANSRDTYFALRNRLQWTGRDQSTFTVPPYLYKQPSAGRPLPTFDMGDWCEFMGWYLSEGCVTLYRDRREVYIAQQKTENIPMIHALLVRMGLTFHYNGRGFVVCNAQLATYLAQFGKAHEKYIPREILELAPPYLACLYSSLLRGDGHQQVRVRKGKKAGQEWVQLYKTTSRRLAGDVQELVLKLGYTASVIPVASAGHPRWRQQWVVNRRVARESTIFPSRHARVVEYKGSVHCCSVEPHHTLVVRRNGRPAVCGNCWWHTIVPTNSSERTGYPTQKPLSILRRIVQASSPPGGLVADFFAGSGTTGAACYELGRRFLLVDSNPEAIEVMARRFASYAGIEFR